MLYLYTAKPNKKTGFNVKEKRPPNGIGYLMSILDKNKIEYEFIDRYCGQSIIKGNKEDIVGIYCTSVCSSDIKNIIEKVDSKVILGGPQISIQLQNSDNLKDLKEFYYDKVISVSIGETEKSICDIVNKNIKGVIKNKRLSSKDLDNLPRFPYDYFFREDRKLFYNWKMPFDKYLYPVFTLNTSRGCPNNCSFCSVKKIWGRRYTYMSVDRILDDINFLIKTFGAKGIYFREDNFTCKESRVDAFCDNILKNNIDIKWACESRVDISIYLLEKMKKSGLIGFYVGVEHLSQKMLDIFNKGINRDQIFSFFENCNKLGIRTFASIITNHPLETDEDRKFLNEGFQIIKPTKIWKNKFREDG